MNQNIADLRQTYSAATLEVSGILPDPINQFEQWFNEALSAKIIEPNAMVLATASSDGKPSARTVLLKGLSEKGFFFYTNYESKKGQQIAANPSVALVFSWLPLERQIRVEGSVIKISREESATYFQSRPKSSQIGASASPQSAAIPSRAALETLFTQLETKYAAQSVLPLPDNWGGYCVIPQQIEFWQGRPSRLHDRISYTLQADNTWKIERLAP
ncbi:MAG: hypothetical protein RI894_829 [Bacteroidota bacterium]|jgi:pyridoxamine-phosphate oxidase